MPGPLKIGGLIVLGIALAGVIAAVGIYGLTRLRLTANVSAPTDPIDIPTDIAAIQRGQHIAGAIAVCTQCHGPTLSGGVVFDNALGRVVAPNLTGGGVGATLSDADFVRAIRYGVDPSGRQLWGMPSDDYNHLSDEDLGALIAYLRSLPPTTSTLPESRLSPMGRALFAVGRLDLLPGEGINRAAPRPPPVGVDVSPAYGEYLATIAGCARCHGTGLSGGAAPGAPSGTPPAANLTPAGLGNWSEADFIRAMRTGQRPDGGAIDGSAMPWPYFAQMTDMELSAIWEYLSVLPPRPTGTH
ncbi:MAG TPA: c-type cytochrome [Chloroflexota bacterium]|jgi:cytochrome c553